MSTENSIRLTRPVLWIVLGMSLAAAVLLQTRLVANLDYEGENSGCESSSLYALKCVRDGRPVYHDFRQPPHVIPPYMPLFFGVTGWAARGLQLNDVNSFLVARGIVYLTWLGVAGMVWAFVRQAGCGGAAAWLATLLWLGSRVAHHWAISVRPDAPALLLSLLAVYVYQRRMRSTDPVVLCLLVAAFFFKQSSVAAWMAIVAEESRRGRWRQAISFTSAWGAIVVLGVLVTQAHTGGAFLENILFSQALPAGPMQIAGLLRAALVTGASSFIGAGLFFAWGQRDDRDRPLRLYFLLAMLVALVGSAKAGAYTNYYLEPFAIGCILTGLFIADQSKRSSSPWDARLRIGWFGVALASGMLALTVEMRQVPTWMSTAMKHRSLRRQEHQRWETVLTALRERGNPVLVEDPYLAVRLSDTPFMVDLPLFAALAERGQFDDSALQQRLADGEFRAVVLLSPLESHDGPRLLPAQWLESMRSRYRLARIFPMLDRRGLSYHVYVPANL